MKEYSFWNLKRIVFGANLRWRERITCISDLLQPSLSPSLSAWPMNGHWNRMFCWCVPLQHFPLLQRTAGLHLVVYFNLWLGSWVWAETTKVSYHTDSAIAQAPNSRAPLQRIDDSVDDESTRSTAVEPRLGATAASMLYKTRVVTYWVQPRDTNKYSPQGVNLPSSATAEKAAEVGISKTFYANISRPWAGSSEADRLRLRACHHMLLGFITQFWLELYDMHNIG